MYMLKCRLLTDQVVNGIKKKTTNGKNVITLRAWIKLAVNLIISTP